MNNKYITNQISTANMKYQAVVEKAEKMYKQEVTQAVHDFIKRNESYYPDGLQLLTECSIHSYPYMKIWNEDGKRVQRTFIALCNYEEHKPLNQYKPQTTYRLQGESLEGAQLIAHYISDLTDSIRKFESVKGGNMFEFGGRHFKGTHTLKDLGLTVVPNYVINKILSFGSNPQTYYCGGFWYTTDSKLLKDWNYNSFRKASGGGYDVFLCMEDGEYYFPSDHKMANIHMEFLKDNIAFWMEEYNEKLA